MKLKIKHTLEEFLIFTIIVFLLISLVVGATIIGNNDNRKIFKKI